LKSSSFLNHDPTVGVSYTISTGVCPRWSGGGA
jgi:hypothetical protein